MPVLGNAPKVATIGAANSIMVEVDGKVRRIEAKEFIEAINAEDEQALRQNAWGIPIRQDSQSTTDWGVVGNQSLYQEFKSVSGRHLVKNDGTAAKLNPTNDNYYLDGAPVMESAGHIMFICPALYYRVTTSAYISTPVLWLSTSPIGGGKLGGTTADGKYMCLGAYKGTMNGNALVSRSGVAPKGSITIDAFWDAAQMNGEDWGLTNYYHRLLMLYLAMSEYGDTDIQNNLGYGLCGSTSNPEGFDNTALLLTGATKGYGDASISIPVTVSGSVDASRVSFLGIEDPYGWQHEMIQGVYFGSSANDQQDGTEMFIYEGNRMPTTAELSTVPSGKYRQLEIATSNGYVRSMNVGDIVDLAPSSISGGSSTTYWADYFWRSSTAGQLFAAGGSAYHGTYCGFGCVNSYHAWSYATSYYGSRLGFYGQLSFTDGEQM